MSVFVSPPGLRGRDRFSRLLLHGDALKDASASGAAGHPYAHCALSFNGSTQYIQTNSALDMNFLNGDFTICGWFNFSSLSASYPVLIAKWDATNNKREFSLQYYTGSSELYFNYSTTGADLLTRHVSWVPSLNAWYFICVVRNSGYIYFYVNGAQVGTAQAMSDSLYACDAPVSNTASGQFFTGCICDVEIAKGVARSGAVPVSRLQADAHTSALLWVSDDGVVLDASGTGKTWTSYGSPQTVTGAPVTNTGVTVAPAPGGHAYLAGAAHFNGTSDQLTIPASADFNFGTGDFTVEAWLSVDVRTSANRIFDFGNGHAALDLETQGFYLWCGGADYIQLWSFTSEANRLYHVRLVKRSGAFYLYVDGVQIGASVSSSTSVSTTYGLSIGKSIYHGADLYFAGHIAEFRVSSGDRGNAVPTAPLETDATTKLLIPMRTPGGTFADASGTGKTVTVVGAPAAVQLPPGGKALMFGGSAYLSCANSAGFQFGSGDFTLDAVVKFGAVGSQQSILSQWQDNKRSWWVAWYSGSLGLWFSADGSNYESLVVTWTPTVNRYYEVAVCRSGSVLRFYIDGVQIGSDQTLSATLYPSTANVVVGGTAQIGAQFTGQISNLRITNGLARWTRNFTPPARLY